MAECVFCRIVKGEIPSARLLETDLVLSFLDIAPVNPGHALVIPKRHSETILELTGEELDACIRTVQKLAGAVMAATGAVGCNVLQNNHRCAGQLVMHAHFHVIPRLPEDGFRFGWRSRSYEAGGLEAMLEKVRAHL